MGGIMVAVGLGIPVGIGVGEDVGLGLGVFGGTEVLIAWGTDPLSGCRPVQATSSIGDRSISARKLISLFIFQILDLP
jgi:hypothetical protein